jgi:mycothiol system anti-sigma-R factor
MGDEIDCSEVVRDLYFFLDGEITEAMRQRIKIHLDDCSPCLEAFDFEAELRQMISLRCREEPPAEFRARIVSVLQVEFPTFGIQAGRASGPAGIPTL